jgi:hypothetical protein
MSFLNAIPRKIRVVYTLLPNLLLSKVIVHHLHQIIPTSFTRPPGKLCMLGVGILHRLPNVLRCTRWVCKVLLIFLVLIAVWNSMRVMRVGLETAIPRRLSVGLGLLVVCWRHRCFAKRHICQACSRFPPVWLTWHSVISNNSFVGPVIGTRCWEALRRGFPRRPRRSLLLEWVVKRHRDGSVVKCTGFRWTEGLVLADWGPERGGNTH